MATNAELQMMNQHRSIRILALAAGAARDLVYRYDRSLIGLMVVGSAGLLASGLSLAGMHAVLVGAVAAGVGAAVTLLCVSVIWGRWSFMRPLGRVATELLVVATLVGLFTAMPMWAGWKLTGIPGVMFSGLGAGSEWMAWQAAAFGALCVLVPIEWTLLAWAQRSTSRCRYREAVTHMLEWDVEGPAYSKHGVTALSCVLGMAILLVPWVAVVMPVYVAMFGGKLFYALWASR